MTNIDEILREDARTWRAAVDGGARPAPAAAEPERRHRSLLATSVLLVAAVLAVTAVAVLTSHTTRSVPPTPGQTGTPFALRRYTWSDPGSAGDLIFNETTVNVSDGCFSGLRQLQVSGHTLTIGKAVGKQSVCGGTTGPPPAGQQTFDRIVSGPLRWSLAGRRLMLTRPDGESLTLVHGSDYAPSITGTDWTLSRVQDSNEQEFHGTFSSAKFVIRDGRLHANDFCNQITANAAATPTTVRFSHVAITTNPCPYMPTLDRVSSIIDAVLAGRRTYSIYRAQELIIYSRSSGLLTYVRSSCARGCR